MAFADIILVNSGSSFDINLSTAQILGTTNGVASVSGALSGISGGVIDGITNGVATVSGTLTGKGTLSGKVDPYLTDDFQAYTEGPLNGQGNWVNNCPSSNGIAVKDTGGDKRFCANVAAEVCARRTETVGNDQFAEFTVDSNINVSGAAVRCSYTSSVYYYFGYYGDSGQKAVFYSVGGSFSTIQYVGGGWTNGDVVRLEIIGTTLKCYRNGVLDPTLTGVYDVSSIIATYSALASGSVGVSGADHADTAGRGDDWRGGASVVSGALKGKGTLAGSTNGVADVSGTLTPAAAGGAIAGTTNGVASVSGLMYFKFLGTSNGVASVSGTLVGDGKLYGTIDGGAAVSATLKGHCHPVGISNGITTVSGTLAGHCHPVGISNGVATCTGVLKGYYHPTGTTSGVATVSGSLHGHGKLYGTINGVATCSASPVQLGMAGISNGVATVTGLAFINLLGVVNGAASCSGILVGKGTLKGDIGVGISLMDSGKGKFDSGTEGWIPYGANTIENDSGALKITYVDYSTGARAPFRATSDLTTNLIVDKTYKIRNRAKRNVGTQLLRVYTGGAVINFNSLTTEFAWYKLSFVAVSTTGAYFYCYGMDSGNVIWIDEWDIVEVVGSTVSGNLKGDGGLAGVVNGITTVSGTLHGHCYPVGVANGIASCSATLVGHCHPVGTTSGVADVSGSLHGHGKLYGTIDGVASCSGRPVQLTMIGQADGVAMVSGLMFFRFHGTINGIASCSAILIGRGGRTGVINGIATVAGILKGHAPKAGITNGVATIAGILHGHGKLYGIINGVESTVGVLKGHCHPAGVINGVSSLTGLFGGTGTLIGLLGGVTTITAELIGWGILSGEISGVALLEGDLSERLPGKCDGIINSIALVGGTLGGWADLVGVSAGVATVTGFYHPLFIGEEVIKQSLITAEISEESFITAEVAWKSIITEEVGDELGSIVHVISMDELLFLWTGNIVNNKLMNDLGDDYITINDKDFSTSYIPVTSLATFNIPNNTTYNNADLSDKLWYKYNMTLKDVTVFDLITYDFSRTLIRYDDKSPHHIHSIGILKSEVILDSVLINKLHTYFDLSIWWNDVFNLNGHLKANRLIGKSVWTNIYTLLLDGDTICWCDYMLGITKDGDNFVSVIADQSGNDNDIQQLTSGKQPLWSENGILFDGVDNYMKTSAIGIVQPTFIYMVFKQVTWTNTDIIMDGLASNTGRIQQAGATPQFNAYAGTSSALNGDLPVNTYGILRCLFNGVNSKLIVNENTAITWNCGTNNMSGITLGCRGVAALYSNIEVKEIIVRKIQDTVDNENVIYNYLKNK